MSNKSLIMKRNSVREFTTEVVNEDMIKALLQSGMQAPSAKNQQAWDFIVVDDRELLDRLSTMHVGSWPLQTATLAIIPMLRPTEKAPWMIQQDFGAVTQNILLEATNLGLGAVWIGVYPLEERLKHVTDIFDIKGDNKPFCIIAIGHPSKTKEVTVRYDESRVYRNKWTNK